jgi:hypothetical protein
MDDDSSFTLEIRIVSHNCRGLWYEMDKVVDGDRTNFADLIGGITNTCPQSYGDIVRMFYFCMDSKVNIPECTDQDLIEMFAKHKVSKRCMLTISYHNPKTAPPEIPSWTVVVLPNQLSPQSPLQCLVQALHNRAIAHKMHLQLQRLQL